MAKAPETPASEPAFDLRMKLTRFRGHPGIFGVHDGKEAGTYAPEFRRQMIELVRAGRTPEELAKELEPSEGMYRCAQTDRCQRSIR